MELTTDIEPVHIRASTLGVLRSRLPALTLTYLRISLSDNRNLSDGSSRHDAKARPIGLLGGEKP